jgi:hypothetical protein
MTAFLLCVCATLSRAGTGNVLGVSIEWEDFGDASCQHSLGKVSSLLSVPVVNHRVFAKLESGTDRQSGVCAVVRACVGAIHTATRLNLGIARFALACGWLVCPSPYLMLFALSWAEI